MKDRNGIELNHSNRSILHSDMNCFYASVEQAQNPSLKGKPVVVAGSVEQRNGIVLAKSYEAKAYGIKTADPLWRVRQLCPDVIVLPPRFSLYQEYSKIARSIYYKYTDLVEPFGLDECWLDVSGSLAYHKKSALEIAQSISDEIFQTLDCTVSIGVGWCKITAKFGSDYKKPNAITHITEDNFKELFWEAPVKDLLYVGKASQKVLASTHAYNTIGDLAHAGDYFLSKNFGKLGFQLRTFARGEDKTPVKPFNPDALDVERDIKSIGNALTCPHDIETLEDAKTLIYLLSESVSQRMRELGLRARTIAISVKDAETLRSYSRQRKLPEAGAATKMVARVACELLQENQPIDSEHAIRAITIRALDFISVKDDQGVLFETDDRKHERLDFTIDDIREKFGNSCVKRGIEIADPSLKHADIKKTNVIHPVGFFHK